MRNTNKHRRSRFLVSILLVLVVTLTTLSGYFADEEGLSFQTSEIQQEAQQEGTEGTVGNETDTIATEGSDSSLNTTESQSEFVSDNGDQSSVDVDYMSLEEKIEYFESRALEQEADQGVSSPRKSRVASSREGSYTINDILGMDQITYINWLKSHENDNFYLGTPYYKPGYVYGDGCDWRNPNGDCSTAHGADDTAGVACMNCTGFVWHALTVATSQSGGNTAIIPGITGWVTFYKNNNMERYYYNSKEELLASGKAGKGDIIWSFDHSESTISDDHHIGIFWGDTPSDNRFWHSADLYTKYGQYGDCNQITPLMGKVESSLWVLIKTDPYVAPIRLHKSSSAPELSNGNSCYSLAGGIWGIFSDSGCTQKVGELTSNANGDTNVVNLPIGKTYYVKETTPPKGYGVDPVVHKAVLNSSVGVTLNVTDEPKNDPFNILLEKKDLALGEKPQGDASLVGAKFQLDFYDSLTVTKEQIQAGAVRPKDSYIFKTIQSGQKVLIDVSNPECFVSSPTGSELYKLGGLITFPVGTIAVREIEAGTGYHIEGSVIYDSENNVESTDNLVLRRITDNGVSSPIHVYQEPTNANVTDTGSIVVMKRDSETGLATAQGDATLEGAVFQFINESDNPIVWKDTTYNTGAVITEVSTSFSDKYNGYVAQVDDLPYGTYRIKEKTSPTGYTHSGTLETVGKVREHRQVVTLVTVNDSIKNEPIRGGISIDKRDFETQLPEAREDTTLKGAEFQIVNLSPLPVIVDGTSYNTGEVVKTIVTNSEGVAQTESDCLPYGTYRVQESKNPEGFLKEGTLSREFKIREDGKLINMKSSDKAILNLPIRGDLEVLKLKGQEDGDEEDHRDPLEGAEFTITSKRTGEVKAVITSDEHGIATTKGMNDERGALIYGTYIVTETFTPAGFKPIHPFEIKIREEGITVKYIYHEDKLISAPAQIVKVDETTDKIIPMAGTKFRVLDSEKNVVEMVTHYPQEVVHTEFETTEEGWFLLPEKLKCGTYYLEELQAPEGYLKGDLFEFQIEEGRDWEEPIIVKYADANAMGKVRIDKTDEKTGEPLEGATFQITAAEDIITNDKTVRAYKGDVVDTITTDENGHVESKELFIGKYLLQEVATPDGYTLNDEVHEFEVEYVDQDTHLVYIDFEFSNKPTEFHLLKKDIDDVELQGIVFELTQTTGDVEETKELTTDTNGAINIEYIKRGSYTLKEKETLPGYVLDEDPRYFVVDPDGYIFETDENGEAIEGSKEKANALSLEWVNDYTKVDISKQDVTGENEVPGATLRILQGEEVIEEWVSTDKPHHINKLPIGEYILHEELTPEGYVTANDVPFTVESTGEIQKVTMTDKQVIVSKTDVTGDIEVEGAHLKVVDKDGNIVDEWDSGKESHPISGLHVGETYTLIEEQAPNGYVVAEEIEFTVEDDGKTQQVEMHDKQVFVNKSNVIDSDGKKVDSDEDSSKKFKLPEGVSVDNKNPLKEDILSAILPDGSDESGDAKEDIAEDNKEPVVDNGLFETDEILKGRDYLTGVKLQVLDTEGNVVDEWVTDGNTHAVTGLTVGGSYILVEAEQPEGYVKASPIEFTVEADDNNDFILMKDKQVIISKVDFGGKELPGAKITISDVETEKVVDEWTSEEKAHPINGLEVGKVYHFHEESAPAGYLAVEDFDFKVNDDFTVDHYTVIDDNTRVEISKVDATDNKELPGAKLTLYDSKGKVVETWTSESKPHMIECLVPGSYRLHEDLAPIGYKVANDVEFEVKPMAEVQKVQMKDEVKPAVKKLVQTGEKGLLLVLSLLLVAGVVAYIRKLRSNRI